MEKEMWRLVTNDISSSWKEMIQHGKELPWASQKLPPLCPCWKQEKAEQGELKASNLPSWSTMWALPGTGTDADAGHSPSLHCDVQATSGDRAVWKGAQLGAEIRLCSPSSSWPEISPKSWAIEKIWGEAETPGSVMRACYSCNPRAQREIES